MVALKTKCVNDLESLIYAHLKNFYPMQWVNSGIFIEAVVLHITNAFPVKCPNLIFLQQEYFDRAPLTRMGQRQQYQGSMRCPDKETSLNKSIVMLIVILHSY